MAFDLATLQKQETELSKKIASPATLPKDKKAMTEVAESLRSHIENLIAFEKLQIGHYVYKGVGDALGKITEKSPGHQPSVFVSWNKSVAMPEQPRLLQLDEIANSGIIKVGDIVRVANKEFGKIIGYRLEKVQDLYAHGSIEIDGDIRVSSAHWQAVEDFDRWDFDWIVGESLGDTNKDEIINTKAALARSSLSTATLALEWIEQHSASGDRGRIEALKKRIRQLESPAVPLPPLEYLRELSIKIHPPIAARKVNAGAVDKLLNIAVAAVTAEELEVAECLITDAQKFAKSIGLVLTVNTDGWLIAPFCKTSEEALANSPSERSRVMLPRDDGSPRLGSVERCVTEARADGVQVQAIVSWDDGTSSQENGFVLETLPPILEYLSNIENAQKDVVADVAEPSPVREAIPPTDTMSPLALGFQEVSVSELRSHPINSAIYGEEEDDTSLDEMIQSSDWIKVLLVTPDRLVVGGNRRLRIAVHRGREKVLVEVREFASDQAVLEALLLDNAVREKTVEQKVREARYWLPIESEKAKSRKGRSENQENNSCGDKGQVRDIVAARVGLGSGRNLQKAEKVLAVIEALKEVDTIAYDGLRHLLNNKSIHAAYQLICANEETVKWRPSIGDRVTVSLKAEHHAGVSGTITSDGLIALVVQFDSPSEGMNQDLIYLNLLLPADVVAHNAKTEAEAEQKNPARKVGLKEHIGGGLLPEKERNEGDPNTILNNGSGEFIASSPSVPISQNEEKDSSTTPPSNVINMPVRSDSDSTNIAREIAMGIRYLSPKELAGALIWAAEDKTNPLSDEHLDAMISAITSIKNERHSQALEIAN